MNFGLLVLGIATRWSIAPCGIPRARAKIARAICQLRFSLPEIRVRRALKIIAAATAKVEKFLTELKTDFVAFTGLV